MIVPILVFMVVVLLVRRAVGAWLDPITLLAPQATLAPAPRERPSRNS